MMINTIYGANAVSVTALNSPYDITIGDFNSVVALDIAPITFDRLRAILLLGEKKAFFKKHRLFIDEYIKNS